jgi:hypothetical protein
VGVPGSFFSTQGGKHVTKQMTDEQRELQELKQQNAVLRGALKDAWLEISNMQHQLKLKQPKDAD